MRKSIWILARERDWAVAQCIIRTRRKIQTTTTTTLIRSTENNILDLTLAYCWGDDVIGSVFYVPHWRQPWALSNVRWMLIFTYALVYSKMLAVYVSSERTYGQERKLSSAAAAAAAIAVTTTTMIVMSRQITILIYQNSKTKFSQCFHFPKAYAFVHVYPLSCLFLDFISNLYILPACCLLIRPAVVLVHFKCPITT